MLPAPSGCFVAIRALPRSRLACSRSGIGVNTAMFTVINAVLLRPLQLPDPERLVFLSVDPKDFDIKNGGLMEQGYLDVREGDHLLEGIATYAGRQATMTGMGILFRLACVR